MVIRGLVVCELLKRRLVAGWCREEGGWLGKTRGGCKRGVVG